MAQATSKRILIIEDERPMARALELKLNHSGYQATSVVSGVEGLRMLETRPFDLILLDLMMPEIDGFGVLEELKRRGSKTPVIVVSNLNQPEDVQKAKELGAVDFIIKSDVPLSNVVERIQKMLPA